MTIDIQKVRSEMSCPDGQIFLNSAGSSLPPDAVHRAVIEHLELERTVGGYEAARRAEDRLERVYDSIARLIGAERVEIALIENATRAWDMAFYAIPFRPGDRILTAKAEYASNYIAYLQIAKQKGVSVDVVPDDNSGQLDVRALEAMIDDRVRLISVSHVPSASGLVQPAAEIGRIARRHGILYLVDACQSVGQLPIDVAAIGCDMLSATGRKFLRGPRGTGFLYVRRDLIRNLEPPMLDLHAATWVSKDRYEVREDARRFENWESFVAGRLGLGAASDYAMAIGLDAIWNRVQTLAAELRRGLSAVDGVRVHDPGAVKCGIVTFTVDGRSAADVHEALRQAGILTSVSLGSYAVLDLGERGLDAVVRASVHYFATEHEIAECVEAVKRLA